MILQSWLFLLISAETILGYCSLTKQEYTAKVKFIREGFEKRVSETVRLQDLNINNIMRMNICVPALQGGALREPGGAE